MATPTAKERALVVFQAPCRMSWKDLRLRYAGEIRDDDPTAASASGALGPLSARRARAQE